MVDAGSSGVMVVLHRDADTEDVMRAYMHAWKVRHGSMNRIIDRRCGIPC